MHASLFTEHSRDSGAKNSNDFSQITDADLCVDRFKFLLRLLNSFGTRLPRMKCIKLYAPMHIPWPNVSPGERRGENERCIRTGPLVLRACEQFHGMIQLRICVFSCIVALIRTPMISDSRDVSIFKVSILLAIYQR